MRALSIGVVLAFSILWASCSTRPTYSTPGALYVAFWVGKNGLSETTEVRNGRVVAHYPAGWIVPRDRPDRSLSAIENTNCSRLSYKVSPDGLTALCAAPSGQRLNLFSVSRPGSPTVISTHFENNANDTSFAWLDDNRLAALLLDRTCPYANLYDFFPTRVVTFDRSGKRLSLGPCAFGIVAGGGRIALLGERANSMLWKLQQFFQDDPRYYNDGYDSYHHTWSVDNGRTWHDGSPLAFDGNGLLLYSEEFDDAVVSQDGTVLFRHVARLQWSK